MRRFTARVVRKSSERTNDSTIQRFLEYLAQRALPTNSAWRATRIEKEEPTKLPEFGWKFSGLIEFTKMGGRQLPELLAKEKNIIFDRLVKAGNFERWGEGRKWVVREISNLEDLPPDIQTMELIDREVLMLTVGLDGYLEVPTEFEEGTTISLAIQDDGTMLLQKIDVDEDCLEDVVEVSNEDEEIESQPVVGLNTLSSTRELTELMRLASDPTRMNIMQILRRNERNVSELCNDLRMSQPAVSHHLAILRTTYLVEPRRDGKHRYYSLTRKGQGLIENLDNVNN